MFKIDGHSENIESWSELFIFLSEDEKAQVFSVKPESFLPLLACENIERQLEGDAFGEVSVKTSDRGYLDVEIILELQHHELESRWSVLIQLRAVSTPETFGESSSEWKPTIWITVDICP